MLLSSYRNLSGSLGEQDILWEHKPITFFKLSLANFH